MSISKGDVSFTVDGTTYTLKPLLHAFSQLSVKYPNYAVCLRELASNNVMTIITVLGLGLGYKDKERKTLPALVMRAGVPALADPCADYVFRLFNAGKSIADLENEQQQAEAPAEEDDPAVARLAGVEEEEENPLLAKVA